ncbi:MAG: DUF2268 domain-containing putative Zn-dependent protease [Alphaproteobacteria bacterium]|nr:DUF2268 domain-containing putative Zn-dependent protease [Alphaproteobacteria bacterium]
MAITYQFRGAAQWLIDEDRRVIEELLNWRIPLLEERLDVQTTLILCAAGDVEEMRREKIRVSGFAPEYLKAIISFDPDRIYPEQEGWQEEFFTSVDHESFHNKQYQAGHGIYDFSFPADFIIEGGATAFEIEMGAKPRAQITVLKTDEERQEAACYAKKYWRGEFPYDRNNWLFGKPKNSSDKRESSPGEVLHRARTGYDFAFSIFSGYCNRVEKMPSDLLYVTAKEVMSLWLDGQITPAPNGPDRAMIETLSKERGYRHLSCA